MVARRLIIIVVMGAVALLIPSFAGAALIFSGSGTGTSGQAISASVSFDIVDHNFGSGNISSLQVTLTNTSAATDYRGNLLTGLFIDLDAGLDPTWTTNSSGFDGVAASVRTSSTTAIANVDIAPAVNNTATDGTYQLSNGAFGTANSGLSYADYEFGISTVGFGLSGFNGAATEGDNYGIAAAGANLSSDGMPSALPVIDTTAVFWLAVPEGFSLDQIAGVRFTFGSKPDNAIDVVPAPAAALLLGSGLLGLLGVGRVKSRLRPQHD